MYKNVVQIVDIAKTTKNNYSDFSGEIEFQFQFSTNEDKMVTPVLGWKKQAHKKATDQQNTSLKFLYKDLCHFFSNDMNLLSFGTSTVSTGQRCSQYHIQMYYGTACTVRAPKKSTQKDFCNTFSLYISHKN